MTRDKSDLDSARQISIHIPLARYDSKTITASPLYPSFQSTYRSRGMTNRSAQKTHSIIISIHIPLARYDYYKLVTKGSHEISIHRPLARYDVLIYPI